jgi:protein-disulfide isomerase
MFSIFVLNLWHYITNKNFMLLLKVPNWNFWPKSMLLLLILPSVISFGIEQAIGVASTNSILPDREVVAHIGERSITLGEIDHGTRLSLNQIDWKRYEIRLQWLKNELLAMEAASQGVTVEELKKKNIDDAVTVSEEEIQKVYESNKKGPLAKVPYEKAKKQLSTLLMKEKKRLRSKEFLEQLKQSYNFSFSLPKPLSLVVDDNPRQGPEKGPAEATVTVVLFTDFECPFCAKAYRQIKNLLVRYPQDIRMVFRHFPLEMHKNALTAAYAAACAHLQGKFWPYADLLFKNQGNLGPKELYDYARQIGLDMEKFKQCMESELGKEIVDADVAEGVEFGIHSTPALFFNGHFIKGAPKPRHIQFLLDQYLPTPDKPEDPKS